MAKYAGSAASNAAIMLDWPGKDHRVIPTTRGDYGYGLVDADDPRLHTRLKLVCEEHVRGMRQAKVPDKTYGLRTDLPTFKDNLLILGESGQVLDALINDPGYAERYVGKVRCVYIDPPFNTLQNFAHYKDSLDHSLWLTMMRDRLVQLKQFLSPQGSIWVHLDDAENHRVRLILDEIFGAANFVTEITWERVDNPSQRDSTAIVASHDYIAVYARDIKAFSANKKPVEEVPAHFNLQDDKGRFYCLRTLRKTGSDSTRASAPNLWFPITAPDGRDVFPIRADGSEGRWRWSREKVADCFCQIDWQKERSGALGPYTRIYFDPDKGVTHHNTWAYAEVGSNRTSKAELSALFPHITPFSTPKPERLMERIIDIATRPGDIVMDVFAGSGTTAAVAHKMGRRWVTCELQEDTFRTFTLPRLRMVANGQDLGGVSILRSPRTPKAQLPAGVSTDAAHSFSLTLTKLLADAPELKQSPVIKTLRAKAKTAPGAEIIQWRGGGGFTVARLGD